MVQTKSKELRIGGFEGNFYDLALLDITEDGTIKNAISISVGSNAHDLVLNPMSLVMADKYLFMGAMNNGFNTNM